MSADPTYEELELMIERVRNLNPCYLVEHKGGWDLFCRECIDKALDGDD